jgi:hypothetical protein
VRVRTRAGLAALAAGAAGGALALPTAGAQSDAPPDSVSPKILSAKLMGKAEATARARRRGRRAPVWSIALRADDSGSGVAHMQIASDLTDPPPFQHLNGAFRQFNEIVRVRRWTPPRWVRVADAAGNVSRWAHIRGARGPRIYFRARAVTVRTLVRRGLRLATGCDEGICVIALRLVISRRASDQFGVRRTIARRTIFRARAGRSVVRLRLLPRARARLAGAEAVGLRLVVRARDLSLTPTTRHFRSVAR